MATHPNPQNGNNFSSEKKLILTVETMWTLMKDSTCLCFERLHASNGEGVVTTEPTLGRLFCICEGPADKSTGSVAQTTTLIHSEGSPHQICPFYVRVLKLFEVTTGRYGCRRRTFILKIVYRSGGHFIGCRLWAPVLRRQSTLL